MGGRGWVQHSQHGNQRHDDAWGQRGRAMKGQVEGVCARAQRVRLQWPRNSRPTQGGVMASLPGCVERRGLSHSHTDAPGVYKWRGTARAAVAATRTATALPPEVGARNMWSGGGRAHWVVRHPPAHSNTPRPFPPPPCPPPSRPWFGLVWAGIYTPCPPPAVWR